MTLFIWVEPVFMAPRKFTARYSVRLTFYHRLPSPGGPPRAIVPTLDLFMDFRLLLNDRKSHVIPANAFGRQTNLSGPTQTVHHSEDLIPCGIRATIEKLVQQKIWLIGKHPEYSMNENALSSFISHGHAPFL